MSEQEFSPLRLEPVSDRTEAKRMAERPGDDLCPICRRVLNVVGTCTGCGWPDEEEMCENRLKLEAELREASEALRLARPYVKMYAGVPTTTRVPLAAEVLQRIDAALQRGEGAQGSEPGDALREAAATPDEPGSEQHGEGG